MTSDRYATGGAPSPDSFYDISDEEERGYSRIAHSSAGRGVKLLYCKSKVNLTYSANRLANSLASHARMNALMLDYD